MKKRLVFRLILLCLTVTLFTAAVWADTTDEPLNYGWCGDSMTWYLDKDHGLLTIEGTGLMYDYIYDFDYSHPAPWYDFRDIITAVDIAPGVEEVGQYAFWGCTKIQSVTLPDTVTSIEKAAFHSCSALESITIPNSVTVIGDRAFESCTALKAFEIPASVTTLGNNAFDYCSSLTEMVIPDTVTSLGGGLFNRCLNLRSVTLPDHMTELPGSFFGSCRSLVSFNFPKNLTAIGRSAFSGCTSLTSMHIPQGVTTIGGFAFYDCSGLTEVTFPSSLTNLTGEQIFANCDSLTKIEIPGTMKTIAPFMFYNCKGLLQIKFLGDAPSFPISSGNVRDTAFTWVQAIAYYPAGNPTWNAATKKNYGGKLTWMAYDPQTGAIYPEEPENWVSGTCGDNAQWKLELTEGTLTVFGSGAIYDYEHHNVGTPAPWYTYKESIRSVTIQSGITAIGSHAFHDLSSLTKVTMADSVATVGQSAFYYCSKLETVSFSAGLTAIKSSAFWECTALKEALLPEGLTFLGSNAFCGCDSLARVLLPSTLTTMDNGVFQSCPMLKAIQIPAGVGKLMPYTFANCTALTEIRFLGNAPVFSNSYMGTVLTGQSDTIFAGVTANAYYPLGNNTWNEGVIGDYGGNITWIGYIPGYDPTETPSASGWCGDNLTWNFYENSGLLIISGTGDMYNYIYSYEYMDPPPWESLLQQIKTVVLEWGVTSVGDYAFDYCRNLTQVILSDTVTTIGTYAFQNTISLESINLHNGIATIRGGAFAGSGLTEAVLPNSVTTLGAGVFRGCRSLTSVKLPKYLSTLPDSIFYYCDKLTSVQFPQDLEVIGALAFSNCHSLTAPEIPEGVTTIQNGAFTDCSGLKGIILPESLVNLGPRVFTYCTALEQITLPASVTKIYPYTFYHCESLRRVYFRGDAPTFVKLTDGGPNTVFEGVRATVYYPERNFTWKEAVMQNYGGSLTWNTYVPESPGKIQLWADGCYYYTVKGQCIYGAGLVYIDGNYYYIRSGGYAATGFYWVSNTNGLLPEGLYQFASDGKMILDKHGIVEENGKLYYYLGNNLQYAAGLIRWESNYYYVRSNGQAVTGQYWITNTNGLLEEGIYTFRTDGTLVVKAHGIVEIDGLLYYFVDGAIQYGAGAILIGDNCYYIRSNGTCAIGRYYVTRTNDLLEEGYYTFGEDGVLIWY